MKKIFVIVLIAFLLPACASKEWEPPYNYLASHINVIGKTSNYVVYEYSDVRIDEVAPIAALYCRDQGGRTAELYDIGLRADHRRRATFMCR
ncbi:MAG: hypothetical protein IJ184_04130 [Alphaproteobacteria bacterium]|nr:hypothetical protein [Alphaproteobacteria bacterium]